jgi:hypothetical protein
MPQQNPMYLIGRIGFPVKPILPIKYIGFCAGTSLLNIYFYETKTFSSLPLQFLQVTFQGQFLEL